VTTQKTQPTKKPATKQVNVTDLTPNQRRQLFIDHMSQNGFSSFSKNHEDKQTFYIFKYENNL
jgi:hypothetical protein